MQAMMLRQQCGTYMVVVHFFCAYRVRRAGQGRAGQVRAGQGRAPDIRSQAHVTPFSPVTSVVVNCIKLPAVLPKSDSNGKRKAFFLPV